MDDYQILTTLVYRWISGGLALRFLFFIEKNGQLKMSFNFLLPNHNSTFSFTLFYQESIHNNEAYFSLNMSFPTLGLNPRGI
jgi:hypothetical protein